MNPTGSPEKRERRAEELKKAVEWLRKEEGQQPGGRLKRSTLSPSNKRKSQKSTNQLLEKAKQFEDDYDDDNYSYYVEHVSAHARDSYQTQYLMASIY
jgi:hypothetical protein